MANLGVKIGTYLIHFRDDGKEHKRSLNTRNASDAAAAKNSVESIVQRFAVVVGWRGTKFSASLPK